jgi:hypothetical protein
MMPAARFDDLLGEAGRAELAALTSPVRIQEYLDGIPYSAEERNRCPLNVLKDRQAHCLDGALFAAAALRRIGHPPVLIDLLPDPGMDDDHVLAIYKQGGHYGALAKSNFAGLRFREAVYRSLRELAMSYFEDYYNVNGIKTLRYYTPPLRLSAYDQAGWMWSDGGADVIEARLYELKRLPLISAEQAEQLSPVDRRSYDAGMLGVNAAGLYQPASDDPE